MTHTINDHGANSFRVNNRYHGRIPAGMMREDAATLTTGEVQRITIENEVVCLHCRSSKSESTAHGNDVLVTMIQSTTNNNGGTFSVPRVGDKIVWVSAASNNYYYGSAFDQKRRWPFSGMETPTDRDSESDDEPKPTVATWIPVPRTGMRIPDGDLDPLDIKKESDIPGRGRLPASELVDTRNNVFFPVSQVPGNEDGQATLPEILRLQTGATDIANQVDVLEQGSDAYKAIMGPLNDLRDDRYVADSDGSYALGFNEISITSRTIDSVSENKLQRYRQSLDSRSLDELERQARAGNDSSPEDGTPERNDSSSDDASRDPIKDRGRILEDRSLGDLRAVAEKMGIKADAGGDSDQDETAEKDRLVNLIARHAYRKELVRELFQAKVDQLRREGRKKDADGEGKGETNPDGTRDHETGKAGEDDDADAAGDKLFKVNTPGGITQYAQDYWDAICTGNSTQNTLGDHTINVGNNLTLEAGQEITLRVGPSAITITNGGVTIGSVETGPFGSSFEVNPTGITSTSLGHTVNTWNHAVNVPFCSFGLSPMNASISALQGFSVSTGWDNYAINQKSVWLMMEKIASIWMGNFGSKPSNKASKMKQAEEKSVFKTITTLLGTMGIDTNYSAWWAKESNTPMTSSTFSWTTMLKPVLGMVKSVIKEVSIPGKHVNGGSSTFSVNKASITLDAGYCSMPSQSAAMLKILQSTLETTASTTAKIGSGTGWIGHDKTKPGKASSQGRQHAAEASIALGAAGGIASLASTITKKLGSSLFSKNFDGSKPPKIASGDGQIRIQSSGSTTSGAYWSKESAAAAGANLVTFNSMAAVMSPAFLLGKLMTIKTNKGYAESLAAKETFAGLTGTSAVSTFVYHSKNLQEGSVTKEVNSLEAEQDAVVDSLTQALLKGGSKITVEGEVSTLPRGRTPGTQEPSSQDANQDANSLSSGSLGSLSSASVSSTISTTGIASSSNRSIMNPDSEDDEDSEEDVSGGIVASSSGNVSDSSEGEAEGEGEGEGGVSVTDSNQHVTDNSDGESDQERGERVSDDGEPESEDDESESEDDEPE